MQVLRPIFGKLAIIHGFGAVDHVGVLGEESCHLRRIGGCFCGSLFFLPVLYVALVAFLHSWGIVAIGVYFVLGKIFLAVLGKMPPPPAGEDDRSNYTLQA